MKKKTFSTQYRNFIYQSNVELIKQPIYSEKTLKNHIQQVSYYAFSFKITNKENTIRLRCKISICCCCIEETRSVKKF